MFSWPSLQERMCRTWGSNSGLLACQANSLPIELTHPVTLLDEEAKKEAWREHYERLLNVEFPWNPEDLSEESPVEGPSEPITLEMITKAISKIASGKAAGPSGIVAEMLKPVGEAGAVEVRDLIEDIISEGCIPTDWQESFIVNLYKGKGDALHRGNYRGLKLIEQVMKVLERVVEGLIRQRVEIDEMQYGFMSGRGTTDAIFIVRQLQEKHLAANRPLHMAFVDLEKAFDRVPRDVIWWAMRKLGTDKWLVCLVQSMYKDVRSRVRAGDGYSEEFGVGVGVHQGSVLSPLLVIIVLEALSREFRTGCPWELLYADDLMFSAESMEELLVKVQTWKTEMEKKGLRVNMGKTKIMESGINLDVLKKSGKYPCGVCQSGVGSSNAIFLVAASAGCIRNAVALRDPCALTLSSGAPDALGLLGLLMKEKFQRLRLERKSLKLSQSSATLGTCSLQEVAASWLRSHAANVHGASSANCFPFSPTAICPFWPEVRCTHHVWGVWCCMQQRLGPWRWIHWTISGVMTVP